MALPGFPELPDGGDGATKLYGMENFGNTCYCNSILQCLYYTTDFRRHVLTQNTIPHDRRLDMPGALPHAYTTKYEQLLAKKLKEKVKPTSQPQESSPSSGTMPSARPSMRNSFFGKFSSQNTQTLSSEEPSAQSIYKSRGYIQEAGNSHALSTEQRLIIQKHAELQDLELLITRPPSNSAPETRTDPSVSSTPDSVNGLTHATALSDPAPISTMSSYVIIGIPIPEQSLSIPINPFSANPSADHRKRSALINGPILNVDHSFSPRSEDENKCLLYSLKDIFESMAENSSQIGVVSPSYFIKKLKEKNFLFRQANMHHDAHEFCNYLINETIETLNVENGPDDNWCTQLFQGTITNETKCLSCETITSKDESFLDLSVDIPPGDSAYSLTFSLNNFSKSETLNHQNKFYCNACSSLQEAVKTIKLKKTPKILIINFKRFKYDDKLDRMIKLFDSISYPLNLRLFNTTTSTGSEAATVEDCRSPPSNTSNDFSLYGLYALVVHIGGGPMHGHYVALCKCQAGLWFLFDDETVELVDDAYVLQFFGDGPGLASAYMLFYEIQDTKVIDDDLDFGIDMKNVYNGVDYSLATSNTRAVKANSNDIRRESSLRDSEEAMVTASATDTMENPGDNSAGRATSLLKKTFMLDSKEGEKNMDASISSMSKFIKSSDVLPESHSIPWKGEKKSWVGGLKRRESKPELGTRERTTSVGSDSTTASAKPESNQTDSSSAEKIKRRGSIFSFKRKNKS